MPITSQLSTALADLKARFPTDFANGNIVHVGITNCRRKNNKATSPWSEHSWSNAGDIMLRNWSGRKALGDKIAAYMRSKPNLWAEVFWQVAYHYDHIHGTAAPRRNYDNKQIPPCADSGKDEAEMKEWIKEVQTSLNKAGFKGADKKVLKVDGIMGTNTRFAMNNRDKAAATGGSASGAAVSGTFTGKIS